MFLPPSHMQSSWLTTRCPEGSSTGHCESIRSEAVAITQLCRSHGCILSTAEMKIPLHRCCGSAASPRSWPTACSGSGYVFQRIPRLRSWFSDRRWFMGKSRQNLDILTSNLPFVQELCLVTLSWRSLIKLVLYLNPGEPIRSVCPTSSERL